MAKGVKRSRLDAELVRRRLARSREHASDLIAAGKEIRYTGPSGIGPIDDENDPSSAFIGIYQYDANNKNVLSGTVEGAKP